MDASGFLQQQLVCVETSISSAFLSGFSRAAAFASGFYSVRSQAKAIILFMDLFHGFSAILH